MDLNVLSQVIRLTFLGISGRSDDFDLAPSLVSDTIRDVVQFKSVAQKPPTQDLATMVKNT